jgi:hypothetical protein
LAYMAHITAFGVDVVEGNSKSPQVVSEHRAGTGGDMWTPHSIGGRQNGPILPCIKRGGGRRRPAIQRLGVLN